MCFSAGASFTASAVLVVVGIASVIKTTRPSQLMFASIPFIFGIQQFSEGVLWLSLGNEDYRGLASVAAVCFIFFAQIVWPMWVPIAIMTFEPMKTRKTAQRILLLVGISVGIYLGYTLLKNGVDAAIIGKHIAYFQDYLESKKLFVVSFYALATIAPPFFSHIKHMWLLGLMVMLSYIIAAIFYQHFVLSVWCFFSSIISVSVFFIVLEARRRDAAKD